MSDFGSILLGNPGIPQHIRDIQGEDFLRFRESQQRKAKYFTNGRSDFLLVEQMLHTFKTKRDLMRSIRARDAQAVEYIFLGGACLYGSYSTEDLANEVLDSTLTTPLHVAVEQDSVDIVKILLRHHAMPVRKLNGDLPWECFGLLRFSRAARETRSICKRLKKNNWDTARAISFFRLSPQSSELSRV